MEGWPPPDAARGYASVDDRNAHRATDVLLFALAHPRWAFVSRPQDAASLHPIAAWWKTLRSLARTGRRSETWERVCHAVRAATAYGDAHRQPLSWGRRRRHRRRRRAGIGLLPKLA